MWLFPRYSFVPSDRKSRKTDSLKFILKVRYLKVRENVISKSQEAFSVSFQQEYGTDLNAQSICSRNAGRKD